MNTTRRAETDRSERGFSLPELLAVMFFIGLFVIFGGPAFNEAYRSYKTRAAADNLVTDLKALRYNAVSQRAPFTITLKNQTDPTSPNQYSYVNLLGNTFTVTMQAGVNIETTSASSVTFNMYGSTGVSGNTTIRVSCAINDTRNDRYTLTVTPTGTISSAYSTF